MGTYEGWYCPNEGFIARLAADRGRRTARTAPTTPRSPSNGCPSATGSSASRPTRSASSATSPSTPSWSSPSTAATRCSASSAPGPRGLLGQPRRRAVGHPVPHRARTARPRSCPTGRWDPGGGHGLRLVRRPDQLHHRRRVPRRPGPLRRLVAGRCARHRQGHRPVPHDRAGRPCCERRPAAAAAGLGPRLAARAGRADEQEPRQLLRSDRRGRRARRRRRPLRHAARGRLRPRQRRVAGSRSSGATTPTWRTTWATSSTAP